MGDNSLAEIFRQLKQTGRCPVVSFTVTVSTPVQEVQTSAVKLRGQYWLGFRDITEVSCDGKTLYLEEVRNQKRAA